MATPTTVNATVFSLAGSQVAARVTPSPSFSDPAPLGVRIFSTQSALDVWVTKWVDNIQYRSVIPGGFASATITLHQPRDTGTDVLGFPRLTALFARIQIVDQRSGEVAWEGRIEDPARQVEPNVWQIGALGSMVAATDVQRPVFYIESTLDRWVSQLKPIGANGILATGTSDDAWSSVDKDDITNALTITVDSTQAQINIDALVDHYAWRWDSHGYDQAISRVTSTMYGSTSDSAAPTTALECILGAGTAAPHLDATTFSAGPATKTNRVGTDWTNTNQRFITFGATMTGSSQYFPPTGTSTSFRLQAPIIQGVRRDITGAQLLTAASYPHDYVLASDVVKDVLGRFLAGGWYEGGNDTPLPGSVRYQDAYIDTTGTTQILNLAYPDGATAADILNDLVTQVQPDAYWAIWESTEGAFDPAAPAGWRFEYATWPDNWGYLATSQDGFEGQPNGDGVYNFLSFRYQDTGDGNVWHSSTTWLGDEMTPELLDAGFTRAVTVNKQDPTDGNTALGLASAQINATKKVVNAGTLHVSRPVTYFDPGTTGSSGAMRTLDPHMIRPGKLVRITDLPPRAGAHDVSYGSTAPISALDGTIFKVVSTDYDSSTGTCTLGLDQVSTWQIPTQITKGGAGHSKTIRIQ